MELHIIQSLKGDCILLESKDGKLILVDGGMGPSMKEYGRDAIHEIANGRKLEAAYVSHIDQDHIAGVLQLLKDELAWRAFDFQSTSGANAKMPDFPKPPEIKTIWHNAFRDQVSKNRGAIENLLAAAAPAFLATGVPEIARTGLEMQAIALSIPEALEVSKLASSDLLDIPVNKIPGAQGPTKLLMRRDGQQPFKVGAMSLSILGPGPKELRDLRKGWDEWLRKNHESVARLRSKIKDNIDIIGAAEAGDDVFALRDWNGIEDYKGVTTPNIASLMFFVEEAGKRIILTGDSQQDFILEGLDSLGHLAGGFCHVDVLKVQHHGSENNVDRDFCRKVSADHYVFCGNGEHGNPEPEVVEMIYESRLGAEAKNRALAPQAAGKPFKFWFSTTSKMQRENSDERENFEEIEALVETLKARSGGKLQAVFNDKSFMTLKV